MFGAFIFGGKSQHKLPDLSQNNNWHVRENRTYLVGDTL